jgi:hypothetical protein
VNLQKRCCITDNKPPVFKPNTFGSSSIEMLSPNKLFLKNGEDQLLKSLFESINSDIKSSKLPIIKKYYPVKVVKSLVHSMWLLLDNKTRKQNETLLKWFLGEFDIFPLFFSYGRSNELDRNFLNFTIWQKYKLNNNYADFVIQFVFAKNIIIFELPCFKLKKYKPSPKTTVQLNTLKETLNIEMLRIKISSNGQLEDNSNIEIGDSSSSTISILDMKGETNTELIKKEILQCEEINNLKQYILEINNYFKVCIPYCIKIDEINKNHIYNLVLCARNNGIYIFQELESLKQKMNETYREFEKFLDQKKPPVISFKENKVFSYGSGLINYSIKIKITKPKYKKATRKEIDYITFFGDEILKSIEL